MGNAESAFDSEAYIQGLEGSQVGSENSAAGATASGKSRSKLADEARDCTQLQVLADGDEVYRRGENYLRYQVAFAEALVEFDRAKGPSDVLACLSQLRETMASFRDLPLLPESLAVTAVSKLASCLSASFPQEVHLETWKTFASIFDKIGPARFARDLPNYSMVVFAAFGLNLSAEVVHELLHLVNSYYLKLPGSHLQPCVGGLMNALLSLKVSGTSNGEASGDAPAVYEKDGSRTSQAGQIQGEARALLVNMRERTDSAKFDILLCQSIVANEGVRTRALSLLLHVVQNMLEEKCTLAFAGTLTSMLAACLMEGCISVQVMCLQIIQEYDSVIPQDYIEEGKHILATSILVTIPSAVTEVSEPALSWLKENCCEAGASGESIVSEAMLEIVESAISRYVFPSSPAPNSHVVSSRAHQGNEWNHVIHIFDVLGSAFQYFPEHFARVARPRHVYELLAASLEIVGDHGDGQVDEALADVARTTCQVFAVQTIWEDLRQFFQSVGLGRGLPVMKVVACPDRWETSSVRVILKATGGTFERMISDLLQHANDLMNLKARTKATWNQLYGLLHYCSGFFFALVEDGVLTKCRTLSHQFRDTFWRFLDMECVQDPEEEQYSLLLGPFQDSPVAELLGVSCRVVLHIEAAWSRSDCSSPGRDPVAFLTNYATGGSVNNSKLTAALVCVKMFGVPMPLGERHVERTREIAMWLWALIHAEDDKLVDSQYSSDAAALFSELLHCAYPICHDVIVQSMQLSSGHRKVVGYLRVSILWNFCRREQPSTLRYLSSRAVGGTVSTPSVLFLMLDAVDSSDARLRFVSQKWLQDALVSPAPVLEALLQPLLGPTMTKLKDEMEYVVAYDTRYVLYVLDRLRTIVRFGSQGLIRAAGAESVPPATVQATLRVCTRAETRKGLRWDKMGIPEEKVSSLLEVLAAALAGLACGRVNAENEDKFEQDNIEVGCQSLELLQELLKLAVPPPCAWRLADLLAPLCVRLLSTRRDHLPYQHAVLGLLSTVLAALTFGGGRVASSSNGSSADGAAKDRAGSGLAIFESNEFLHVLEEGMVSAAAAHSHILVDWVDFCVRCLSCIWLMSPTAAPRLISVMCNVVQERTSNLRSLLLHQEECLVLLGGLAQITQQCVLGSMPTLSSKPITVSPKNSEAGSMKGRDKPDRRGSQVTSMLSDFVKNVFAGNTSGRTVDNSHDPRNLALQMLPQLLDATFSIWEALTHLPNSLNEHARQVVESIKKAVARLLSPLAAAAPLEYFDSVTTLWALHNRAHGTSAADVVLRMVHATEGATLKRLFSAARKLTTTICNSAQDDLDVHSKGNRVSEIVGFLYSFLLSEAQETHAGLHIAWEQFKTVLALLIGTDISSRIDSATDPDTIAVNSAAGYSAGGASPTMVLLKGKGPLWALRLLQAYVKAAGTLKRSDCAQEQQIVNEVLFACFFTATSTPRETPTHGAVGVSDEGDIGGLILSQTVAALPSLLDWAYEQLKGDSDRELELRYKQAAFDRLGSFVSEMMPRVTAVLRQQPTQKSPNSSSSGDSSSLSCTILESHIEVLGVLAAVASFGPSLRFWRHDALALLKASVVHRSSVDVVKSWMKVGCALFSEEVAFQHLEKEFRQAKQGSGIAEQKALHSLTGLATGLRVLAFSLLCGERDRHVKSLAQIMGVIRDAFSTAEELSVLTACTRSLASFSGVAAFIPVLYYAIRVLVCRFSEEHLQELWGLLVPSLVQVFRMCHPELHTTPSGFQSANNLLVSALQMLDVLILYQPEDFNVHKWVFLGIMQRTPSVGSLATAFGGKKESNIPAAYVPYVTRVKAIASLRSSDESSSSVMGAQNTVQPEATEDTRLTSMDQEGMTSAELHDNVEDQKLKGPNACKPIILGERLGSSPDLALYATLLTSAAAHSEVHAVDEASLEEWFVEEMSQGLGFHIVTQEVPASAG